MNVLRDVMEAKSKGRPYVITFCGVNGVGKSTNLAKVCFWLLDNGYRVLVVGGDTFRAGNFFLSFSHFVFQMNYDAVR